ncbi:TfuA-related McrA-glycine thioamidation protein [Lyngbya aestuarii]|uniref:TfuA-related McrA-glycine thioamidation protein n=1 Tax=Lyngbya aestuarii TaxID=118322 RepID=UPI00403E0CE8
MKKIIIFLGPSLPVVEARKILDAIYLPPAKQADLISAIAIYKPDIIGLIDGVFLSCPSVWHKEILYALEQGISVYGASSMGALRAVETEAFGMVGVGEVYRMYASGELIDDDEVALVYGPEDTGYRPLSEPMLNIRYTFRRAQEEGVISNDLCEQLLEIAKSIYFPERTFFTVFRQAMAAGIAAEEIASLRIFSKDKYLDIKQQDTVLLLQTLRDLPETSSQFKPDFKLVRNQFFATLYDRDRTVLRQGTTIPLGDIAGYAALHLSDFNETNLHAANRALVQILAEIMGVNISQSEIDKENRRFRLQHNLFEETAFTNWLGENDLTSEEFQQLMSEVACCRKLQSWLFVRKAYEKNTKIFLDELRLQNRYQESANAAAELENFIQQQYPHFPEDNYDDLTVLQLVIEHRRSNKCQVIPQEEWLKEAGFLSPELLKLALLRSHLARQVTPSQDEDSAG